MWCLSRISGLANSYFAVFPEKTLNLVYTTEVVILPTFNMSIIHEKYYVVKHMFKCFFSVLRKSSGGGWIQIGEFAHLCVKQSWRKLFIVTSPIMNPTPILDLRSARELGPNIHVAPRITTLRPLLRSGRQPNLLRAKWVHHFRGHESTKSGKYDLPPRTHHPINPSTLRGNE